MQRLHILVLAFGPISSIGSLGAATTSWNFDSGFTSLVTSSSQAEWDTDGGFESWATSNVASPTVSAGVLTGISASLAGNLAAVDPFISITPTLALDLTSGDNDVITGVNGRKFEVAHTFGHHLTRMKKFPEIGYEGPLMDFGNAIEESEGGDGRLILMVTRDGKQQEVVIRLEAIGRFAKTYPFKCKKSQLLAERAAKYLTNHPFIQKEQCHAKCMSGLALLASGQMDQATKLAHSWLQAPRDGIWVWPVSYQCIFLSEYYLLSKDEKVLKTIQALAAKLETAQVEDMTNYKDRTHGKMGNVGHKFRTGGFGHNTNVGGYGTMNITTALALAAWELAKKCGAEVDQAKVDLGFDYLRKSTDETGYIGYHTKRGAYSAAGRQGLALIAHDLAGESKVNDEYINLVSSGLIRSKKYLNDAHADNILSVCWGLLGSNVSGDEKTIREMMDYNLAWLNMARCHEGSFVSLPGRDMYDKGYYMSSRLHLTAAMALVYAMEEPVLQIQGK
ncbi:DUF6288 domain-containing protein [Akkermansiaceae bacterium]|nr:DUF6288 domain-containing protein [Akkermansiaceae bacterium]